MVVDSDMNILPAGTASFLLAVLRDAVGRVLEAPKLLDVQVKEDSVCLWFIAIVWPCRRQHRQTVQLFILENPSYRILADPERTGDMSDAVVGVR